MGRIFSFILSLIEMFFVSCVAILFIYFSAITHNFIAFVISTLGFIIYTAVWRLRFK